MNLFGAMSYSLAAIAYAVLVGLLVVSSRGQRTGVLLIGACTATVVWALINAVAGISNAGATYALFAAELLRGTAWLLVLVAISLVVVSPALSKLIRQVCVGVAACALIVPVVLWGAEAISIDVQRLMSWSGFIASALALMLLWLIRRTSVTQARRALKPLIVGAAALFVYDLFVWSMTEWLGQLPGYVWSGRGLTNVLAVPLIAVAARRNPEWSLDVFVSRQVVFYVTTAIAAVVCLAALGLAGLYVHQHGGAWVWAAEIGLFLGAIAVVAIVLGSEPLHRRMRVFLSKHFYRNKYDYRVEWLRFIATLSDSTDGDVGRTAVHAVAQVFDSPAGVLFLHRAADDAFAPCAAWPMRVEDLPQLRALPRTDHFVSFLDEKRWIVDLEEFNRRPSLYGEIAVPSWLADHSGVRIISPLVQQDRLFGFIAIFAPPAPFELTFEDRDLLNTLGRHVATHLAQRDADRRLAESRQFEAYNRLTAFMMHDLKNSAAQLKLIVDNAERHKRNPDFVDDAIGTIANAAERITRLIDQFRGSNPIEPSSELDVTEIAAEAIKRCAQRSPAPRLVSSARGVRVAASREKLLSVIEHLIRNSQEATTEQGVICVEISHSGGMVQVAVTDDGVGMDEAFIRDRLFRPFDSTKGAKGMGVGAYQVREYVIQLGGKLEVESAPGRGARFRISLPAAGTTVDNESDRTGIERREST